jgi:hypothetical protein
MHCFRLLFVFLLSAAGCFAQDQALRAAQADGRAAAAKQVAIILLQAQSKPIRGPVSTPEQDRINNLIARDYQIVQAYRARWRRTPYFQAYEAAFQAAMRDPALRKQDPFADSPPASVPMPSPGSRWDLRKMPGWQLLGLGIVGLLVVRFVFRMIRRMLRGVTSPVRRPAAARPATMPSTSTAAPAARCYLCNGNGFLQSPGGRSQCQLCGGTGRLQD